MSLVSQMAPEMKTAMDASLRWHDDYGVENCLSAFIWPDYIADDWYEMHLSG